jgi:hypothetical protein
MGQQYFVTATYMAGIKNHNIGVGPLKRAILKSTPIFDISRLNTAAANNILLVSAGKPTNISIGYCYQPI